MRNGSERFVVSRVSTLSLPKLTRLRSPPAFFPLLALLVQPPKYKTFSTQSPDSLPTTFLTIAPQRRRIYVYPAVAFLENPRVLLIISSLKTLITSSERPDMYMKHTIALPCGIFAFLDLMLDFFPAFFCFQRKRNFCLFGDLMIIVHH